MIKIGKYNNLKIVKKVDFGYYLDGENFGEILLPQKYALENIEIDNFIDVFIYSDSDDRLIATTETPLAQVDDIALLKVVSVNQVGAFLNWGLIKDLLVPFSEQKQKMEEGRQYIVKVYLDEKTNRIVATAKIDRFLDLTEPDVYEGEQVEIMVYSQTDLGYKVIINNAFWGVLYENEIFRNISRGEKHIAFIKKIREDKKIDVTLDKPGFEKIDTLTETILLKLNDNNGFLSVTDKSSSEKISEIFGVSKKTYKKAIGALYKKRLIELTENGIRLVKNEKDI
jgi:predicted RNA-binding protein (virulence factor B family)